MECGGKPSYRQDRRLVIDFPASVAFWTHRSVPQLCRGSDHRSINESARLTVIRRSVRGRMNHVEPFAEQQAGMSIQKTWDVRSHPSFDRVRGVYISTMFLD
jgi:hypothetical protein